eukprot:5013610-Pyramimonas_sp.AAC.1
MPGVTELLATLILIFRTSSMNASRWERSAWESPSARTGGGGSEGVSFLPLPSLCGYPCRCGGCPHPWERARH